MSWRSFVSFLLLISAVLPVGSVAATKPDVILITLDSVRADRVGFLGSRKNLSPGLDALARQGIIFERAYSQSPLTVESNATILTGTYPQTHRASELAVPLAAVLPYLPDLLHAQGYRTAAFVGSVLLDPQNGPFQGYARGFDSYDAVRPGPQGGNGAVVPHVAKLLASHSRQPLFLWVNLHDFHGPSASYDRAVAATDGAVSQIIKAVQTQKRYDGALIVVVSTHGESLGAHGEDGHGIFLYDETIHVPLVVKLPEGKTAGKRVTNRARLVDIAPTVLEACGIPVPSQMQGQSLLRVAQSSSQADQPAYARSDLPQQGFGWSPLESWRAGKYLYVRAPQPELYDLSADPGATHNLAQTSKATLDTIAAQMQAFDNHLSESSGKAVTPGLTSSQMQLLASLGYVGIQKTSGGVNPAASGTDPKSMIAVANHTLPALLDVENGRLEKAIPAFQQVLAKEPNVYLAQYGMGWALAKQQQYSKAIAYLHKAIELQPDSAWAHYEMGLSLAKTGDFKTAAVHLEIASGRLPELAAVHSTLADVYTHLGRNEDANRERTRISQLQK